MSLKVKKDEHKEYPMPSPGNHAARCYQVVDLGMKEKGGQYPGIAPKIRIAFEIDEKMEDGKPFSVSEILTASLHEKSKLYQRLVSWRGRAFTEDELEGFDLSKLVGAPCMINVIINNVGDRQFANINSITPMPKGMKADELVNPRLVWEWGDPVERLPEYLQKMLGEDPRHKPPATADDYADVNTDDELDDIPFN